MTEVALDTATPHAPSVIRLLLDKVGIQNYLQSLMGDAD